MTQNEPVYAICCWREVADDVISGYNVDTFRDYHSGNLWVASFSSFLENRTQPLEYVHLGPIFGVKKQKCLNYLHQQTKRLNLPNIM